MGNGLWLVACAFAAGAPSDLALAPPSPAVARITLGNQRAAVDRSSGVPVVRVSAVVKSVLAVPVDWLSITVVYGETVDAVGSANLSDLYARGRRGGESVGLATRRLAVTVPPRGEAALELAIPIDPAAPRPRAFFTDVVSYGLAELDAKLLLDLLATAAPADEAAAVDALGLKGSVEERRAARARFGAKADLKTDPKTDLVTDLVTGLASELESSVPERPSEAETFRRVYAARALGVLGGSTASRVLSRFGANPGVNRFDEPLQVLRIARLAGSAVEAPLAFAVPAATQNMSEVVRVALADVTELDQAPPTEASASPAREEGETVGRVGIAAPVVSGSTPLSRDVAEAGPRSPAEAGGAVAATATATDPATATFTVTAPASIAVALSLTLFFVLIAVLGYLLGRRRGRARERGTGDTRRG